MRCWGDGGRHLAPNVPWFAPLSQGETETRGRLLFAAEVAVAGGAAYAGGPEYFGDWFLVPQLEASDKVAGGAAEPADALGNVARPGAAMVAAYVALDATSLPVLDATHPLGIRTAALWLVVG